MKNVIIKVEDLNFYYGEKQALFNINMDIYENKVTALIGPSGCGKSTFLRNLNRMNEMFSVCMCARRSPPEIQECDLWQGNICGVRVFIR